MHYLVFIPDKALLRNARFHAVAHVPAIFDEKWKYHKAASYYLIARAKGEAFGGDGRQVTSFPVEGSLQQYAYTLCDFLAWCDWISKPWTEIIYFDDLVQRYQKHMLDGIWAATPGEGLSPRTVNRRVDEAVSFLKWAGHCGLRSPFEYATKTISLPYASNPSGGETRTTGKTRTGKARQKPSTLVIPKPNQISPWIKSIRAEKGETKVLMTELVLDTGIRREECVQWRRSYLPADRAKWNVVGDEILVTLKYGTKGNKERDILVPVKMADRLREYEQKIRPASRLKYVRAPKDLAEQKRRLREPEDRLFLSEHDGRPVSPKKLYQAWTKVSNKPVDHWSPHLGRHWWACNKLLQLYNDERQMMKDGWKPTTDWITSTSTNWLETHIKPQLGHVDARTSAAYITWMRRMATGPADTQEWIDSLEIMGDRDSEE